MSGKHLFVTDLDGTLLGADSKVSGRSAAIITDLSRRGALITVATARTPGTVEPLLADTLTVPPAVVMTGAAMWHRREHLYTDARLLTEDKATEVCRALIAHGISPMVYEMTADGLLLMHCAGTGTGCHSADKFIAERSSLDLKRVKPCIDPTLQISGSNIVLILAAAAPDRAMRALTALEAIEGLSVSHYSDPAYPDAEFIEVFTEEVDKARGIQRLKELTGADTVTVFGDSLNDIPMMRVADRSVAVANALPQVRQAADIVIGPNTDDAVALFILNELTKS